MASDTLEIRFQVENCGVAPIYRAIPVKLRLVSDTCNYEFTLPIDIRTWLPGKKENTAVIHLPKDIDPGSYRIELGILGNGVPMIHLCTDAELNGEYYTVGEMNIEDTIIWKN